MRTPLLLLVAFLQVAAAGPLPDIRATLGRLSAQLDEHKATFGATPEPSAAKHQLRDWVDGELDGFTSDGDARAFAERLHVAIRNAGLLCDDCTTNVLGYVDDVRVERSGVFLIVETAIGLACGYDESAYVYFGNTGAGGESRNTSSTPRTASPQATCTRPCAASPSTVPQRHESIRLR